MAKKVLIIDDEPDWLEVLGRRLTANGFEVLTAPDGNSGYDVAVRQKPDLILLDVLMPQMTGYEFVQKLRSEGGSAKDIPILVLSARKSMEEYFNSWDIIRFVPKPSMTDDLIGEIQKIVGETKPAPGAPLPKTVPAAEPSAAVNSGRTVMIVGVDDYIVHKVKTALEAKGIRVVIGLNPDDVLMTAGKEKPGYIFCQFYEDSEKLDAQAVFLKLKKSEKTSSIPFVPFCTEAISLDALKTFSGKEIVTFKTGNDLVQKLEDFLKSHA